MGCAAPAGVVFSSETRPRMYRRVEARLAAPVAGAGLSMSAPCARIPMPSETETLALPGARREGSRRPMARGG